MRCTQNPTIGEEWRRGWHPEIIAAKGSEDSVLVVGAGPAGLEAALALGRRGYRVGLAEARREVGGRVTDESSLPGFAEWARVRDYRAYQIDKLHDTVEVFRESHMTAETVSEAGYNHVAVATGSHWRKDGLGRAHTTTPVPGWDQAHVITPNDVFAGAVATSPVVVYDDDHYMLGGAMAEKLVADGLTVTLVTPAAIVSAWTEHTLEQEFIQAHLMEIGVEIITSHSIITIDGDSIEIANGYSGETRQLPCATLVMVTSRQPNDGLFYDLKADPTKLADAGIKSVKRIGDAYGPGLIAAAVWSGHRYARELDGPPVGDVPLKRELVMV
jgi:dimethylamine/trimethylamine dehydrogenase